MSTPNFSTQKHFPLYCIDDSGMEWWEAQESYNEIQHDLEDKNDDLVFFRISCDPGYYMGAQFYVHISDYADNAGFTQEGAEYADNESCRYWLDMCLSEAKRKFETERRKVNRLLAKLAERHGFEEYVCVAFFSNGEAWYEKASNKRAKLKAAAIA